MQSDSPFLPPLRPRVRSFAGGRAITALILREMASTYGRSPGGYLWAVLEPVAGVALLSIVFSLMFRSPSLGDNFPFFYASGFLPFMMYTSVSQAVMSSIRYSRKLLEYPAVTFVDALAARFLLNMLTQSLVLVIVIGSIVLFYDLRPLLDWLAIFNAIAMAGAVALGVGSFNCFLTSMYPLWERIWAVMTRPLFIISGVLFLPENLPGNLQGHAMLNPLMHVTSEMRNGLYGIYDGKLVDSVYVYAVSAVMTLIGLFLLMRYHKEITVR